MAMHRLTGLVLLMSEVWLMYLAKLYVLGAVCWLLTASSWAQDGAGDPELGERVFQRCVACHSFDPAQRRPGPHLAALFGRQAGSVEGYRYSKAMQESEIIWTEETLAAFLANPTQALPGTTMFVGIPNDQDVRDVIAFLQKMDKETEAQP
jgi:cytochrome c